MVRNVKQPTNSKLQFKLRLAKLEKEEPFTPRERKNYSFQTRNFIRGIQLTRGVNKRRGIEIYEGIKGKKTKIRKAAKDICELYSGKKKFKIPAKAEPVKDIAGKTKIRYEYKGAPKKAPKSLIDRFKPDYSTTARRYIDRQTGENISRRERDKRIAEALPE